MRVPLEWLREYVDIDIAPDVLAERLAGAGLPAEEVIQAGEDVVLDLEVTSNRPDCMCLLGIAREVGLLLSHPVRLPDGYAERPRTGRHTGRTRRTVAGRTSRRGASAPVAAPRDAGDRVRIEVEDPAGCPRFTAAVIEDVRIGPSPAWMRRRLEAAGVRAINTVVDVTNYVMLETGQPMHAFDCDRLGTRRLLVRRAHPGETLETLDGVTRTLDPDMLVITDGTRPVSLAGIIGGRDTEIGDRTATVLLEAAYWHAPTIGRTARRLGLRTEAAARFERGADPNAPPAAQSRAAWLLAEMSAGRALAGMVDVYPAPVQPATVRLRPARACAVLGTEIAPAEMVRILRALGCRVTPGRTLSVQVPTFRPDLVAEVDLIEELARVYGYDRVPATLPRGDTTPGTMAPVLAADRAVRDTLAGCGLVEALTLTLVRSAPQLADGEPRAAIANPLTQDHDALRRSLVPGVLEVLATNAARRIGDAHIFELGRIFVPGGDGHRPWERRSLAIALMGRWRRGWNVPAEHASVDLHHLRWILDVLCEELALSADDVCPLSAAPADLAGTSPLGPARWWHPGRSAELRIGGHPVARYGEVHPDLVAASKLPHRAYVAEIDLEALYGLAAGRPGGARVSDEIPPVPAPRPIITARAFTALPRYPEIERDLAAVVPDAVAAGRVETIIREAAGPWLEAAELFDVYAGPPIPAGHRSLAYRVRLRAPDRTLAADDAEEILTRVRIALRTRAGAELRE